MLSRVTSEHMSRTLGQQFVIENAVGAGGTTGLVRCRKWVEGCCAGQPPDVSEASQIAIPLVRQKGMEPIAIDEIPGLPRTDAWLR